MFINNGIGLWGDGASFFKFYGLNVEQCQTGVKLTTNCPTNLFSGVHMELNSGTGYSDATSAGFELAAAVNTKIESLHMSMNADTQSIIKVTGSASEVSYHLTDFSFPSGTIDIKVIDDNAVGGRGITKLAWTDFKDRFVQFIAPLQTNSFLYEDDGQVQVVGITGRALKMGSVNNAKPTLDLTPGTTQTGDQIVVRNDAGVAKTGVKFDGSLYTLGGTFTLIAGSKTVSDTRITANSVVLVTLKTAGGVRVGNPDIVPTASTGFVATGGGSDTSTYNYVIINNA